MAGCQEIPGPRPCVDIAGPVGSYIRSLLRPMRKDDEIEVGARSWPVARTGPAPLLGYPTVSLALLLWVPACIVAFATMRAQHAALFALLGGMLFLPERRTFDFSGLPPIGKMELAGLGAMAGCLLLRRGELVRGRALRGLESLVLLAVPFSLATVLLNRDPTGLNGSFPGLRPYDALGMVFSEALLLFVPFMIGRTLFRTPAHLRLLLHALVAVALGYSLLILYEIRMSPQLNYYLYGYSQHSWIQVQRFGGWRPMVFMSHGLALSMFVVAAMLAAAGAQRAGLRIFGVAAGNAAAALGVVLVLCKSLASILYGAIFAPLVLLARPRLIGLAAVSIGALVLLYPAMRSADVVPTTSLVEFVADLNEDRAASMETRFASEDGLLGRATERLWFGWGGFARSRQLDSQERLVTDGYWILRLGERGLAGLLLYFALMLWPIQKAFRCLPRCGRRDAYLLASLALVVAVQTLDTVPNALFNSFPVMLAGALQGLATGVPQRRGGATRPPPGADPPGADPAGRPAGGARPGGAPAPPGRASSGRSIDLAKGGRRSR